MNVSVNITIAEPSEIIRSGLRTILKTAAGLRVELSEVREAEQIGNTLVRYKPDILIINPSLPGLSSLRRIRREIAGENMKCAALQYALCVPSWLSEFDEVISIYDTADQIREKIIRLTGEGVEEVRREALSAREKEVVACVVKGMTNKQIADHLCLSAHTVITHRRNISAKLQIHSTAGLTIYAIVNRLVELDDVKSNEAI